jgi:hypothetical protein
LVNNFVVWEDLLPTRRYRDGHLGYSKSAN